MEPVDENLHGHFKKKKVVVKFSMALLVKFYFQFPPARGECQVEKKAFLEKLERVEFKSRWNTFMYMMAVLHRGEPCTLR